MGPRRDREHVGRTGGGSTDEGGGLACCPDHFDDVIDKVVVQADPGHQTAGCLKRVRTGDRFQIEFAQCRHHGAVAVQKDHVPLFVLRRIIDLDLEQEPVQLGFGQGVGALLLDGILGRDDHEVRAKRMGVAVDGDTSFLHGLQEGRLGFRGCPVYLVGQKDVREDGPLGQGEGIGLKVEEVGSDHVSGHEVGCELDPVEGQIKGSRETAGQQGFGRAGNTFQEHMTVAEKGDQHQVDGLVLAENDPVNLAADHVGQIRQLIIIHFITHWSSPVASGKSHRRDQGLRRGGWFSTSRERLLRFPSWQNRNQGIGSD